MEPLWHTSDEDNFIRTEPLFADNLIADGLRVLSVYNEGKAALGSAAGYVQKAACLGTLGITAYGFFLDVFINSLDSENLLVAKRKSVRLVVTDDDQHTRKLEPFYPLVCIECRQTPCIEGHCTHLRERRSQHSVPRKQFLRCAVAFKKSFVIKFLHIKGIEKCMRNG